MRLARSYIDPVSTSQLIDNLSSAIDEANLVNTLAEMKSRIQKIEATNASTETTQELQREIQILQLQINYIHDLARFSKEKIST